MYIFKKNRFENVFVKSFNLVRFSLFAKICICFALL